MRVQGTSGAGAAPQTTCDENDVPRPEVCAERKEQLIASMKSAMVEGYWFCATMDFGKEMAMSSRMGLSQDHNVKLIGRGAMKDEALQRIGFCKRKYNGRHAGTARVWFALLVDGAGPSTEPNVQVRDIAERPMPRQPGSSTLTREPLRPLEQEQDRHRVKRAKNPVGETAKRSPPKAPLSQQQQQRHLPPPLQEHRRLDYASPAAPSSSTPALTCRMRQGSPAPSSPAIRFHFTSSLSQMRQGSPRSPAVRFHFTSSSLSLWRSST